MDLNSSCILDAMRTLIVSSEKYLNLYFSAMKMVNGAPPLFLRASIQGREADVSKLFLFSVADLLFYYNKSFEPGNLNLSLLTIFFTYAIPVPLSLDCTCETFSFAI